VKARRVDGAPRPDEVYAEIRAHIERWNQAPTVTELTDTLDCGRSTIQRAIAVLVAEKRLSRYSKAPRALKVLK
jgi:DNA-binding GntR family transcriptional regulator